MATEVTICNLALQMTKNAKRIESLTQGTKEANACEELYPEARDELLEMHYWNFAMGRDQLAKDTQEVPLFGWDFAYQLPADFLRIRSVHGNSHGRTIVPYKHEGDNILSDSSELFLRYTKRITDPNRMSTLFRKALSRLIATRLATVLANSASRATELERFFEDNDLPRAKSADSIQDQADQLPESDWLLVRHGDDRFSVDPETP